MALFNANSPGSSALTLPPALAVNDTILFYHTGTRTHGTILRFRLPTGGNYRVGIAGGSGSEGNQGTRAAPNALGGRSRNLDATLRIGAADLLAVIVGHKGEHLPPTPQPGDGAAGGSGGGTFLFKEDIRGRYQIGDATFTLLAMCAGGGGANDYGYQGSRTDGADALTTVFTAADLGSVGDNVQTYCTNGFIGGSYTRSNSTSFGGFGGGGSSDDSPPNAVGFTVVNRAGSSYVMSGSFTMGGLRARDTSGEINFTLLSLIETGRSTLNDDGFLFYGNQSDYKIQTSAKLISVKAIDART